MEPNLTLRQLRAFLEVARACSFTQAAARLRLTQPAVTAAIHALEAEVGLRLLDRSTRAVSLTRHGERFLATAERLLEEVEQAVDDLRAHAERQRGQVVAATPVSFIGHVFAPALASLGRRYPGIQVRLIQENTEGAIRRVQAGEVDFAITTLPGRDASLEAVSLVRDRFGLLCPADHPLCRAARPPGWRALAGERLVGLTAQNGIRLVLERHAGPGATLERPRHEVSSAAALQSLVEEGLGVAVLPALAARPMTRGTGLAFLPLRPQVWRMVYLVRRPGRAPTPAAAEVVATLVERLRALRGEDVQPLAAARDLAALGFAPRAPAAPAAAE